MVRRSRQGDREHTTAQPSPGNYRPHRGRYGGMVSLDGSIVGRFRGPDDIPKHRESSSISNPSLARPIMREDREHIPSDHNLTLNAETHTSARTIHVPADADQGRPRSTDATHSTRDNRRHPPPTPPFLHHEHALKARAISHQSRRHSPEPETDSPRHLLSRVSWSRTSRAH